jgi:hypothetical protein
MHRSLDELAKLTRATAQMLLERSGRDPDANLAHLAELLAERAMALANEVIETKERADRMSTRFGPFLAGGCDRHIQVRVGNPASFCLSCRSGVQHERTDACEAVPAVAGGPLPGERHTYVPPALLGARGYCCACGEPREHPLHVEKP